MYKYGVEEYRTLKHASETELKIDSLTLASLLPTTEEADASSS
jgi:hypothetical protein